MMTSHAENMADTGNEKRENLSIQDFSLLNIGECSIAY